MSTHVIRGRRWRLTIVGSPQSHNGAPIEAYIHADRAEIVVSDLRGPGALAANVAEAVLLAERAERQRRPRRGKAA